MSASIHAWTNGKDTHTSVGTLDQPELEKIGRISPSFFTCYESWDANRSPRRLTGEYALGSATGTLVIESGTCDEIEWVQFRLSSRFKTIEDGRKLHSLIRAGKVLPVLSYEGVQAETAIRQFRDLIREFFILCRVTLRRWEVI